jgi:hypothetical protein
MKTCIINQFYGVGDILFIMPIAYKYLKMGYRVIWPTIFTELQKHFPDIIFIDKQLINIDYNEKKMIDGPNFTILPLRWACEILKLDYHNAMAAKYKLLDIPVETWRETLYYWKEDTKAEDELFYNILNLTENTKYTLINNMFTRDFTKSSAMQFPTNDKNIYLDRIEGFTLLDWIKVIKNADKIYTVSTSIVYLIELLDLKAKEIHIFSRPQEPKSLFYIDYLLTKDCVLHI